MARRAPLLECRMTANDERAGEILILTGSPGAGKSTVASELAAAWPTPAIHLHSDDFYHFIKSGYIAPYLPESHGQNVVVIDAVSAAARAYSRGGYFVAVDGIFGVDVVLGRMRPALESAVHYIVLRPDLDTALARAKTRKTKDFKEPAVIRGLYKKFAQLGDLEKCALDTSSHSLSETVEAVRLAVTTGTCRIPKLG